MKKNNDIAQRYVFFVGSLTHGGAERVISILTKYMLDMGKDVKLVLYYDTPPFYTLHPNLNVVFVERETKSKNIFTNLSWMRKFFKGNADVVVSFLAPFNILIILSTLGLRKKIIVSDRNDPRFVPSNPLVRRLRDFLYRFANGVVVQTSNNKKYFSKVVQKKTAVIFNPVDLGEKRGQALHTCKDKKIVSVGRLVPQKNQKMLIDVFAQIHKDFPDYTLTIYGEGNCREELESQIKDLRLEGVVNLPGNKKNIYDHISNAELFVLSSNYEGMPNALIEAMCLGLPVISTAVSGTSDLIEDGVNGKVVPVADKEQMIEAVRHVLSNTEIQNQYATNAVKINDKLKVDIVMEEWINFIAEAR